MQIWLIIGCIFDMQNNFFTGQACWYIFICPPLLCRYGHTGVHLSQCPSVWSHLWMKFLENCLTDKKPFTWYLDVLLEYQYHSLLRFKCIRDFKIFDKKMDKIKYISRKWYDLSYSQKNDSEMIHIDLLNQ